MVEVGRGRVRRGRSVTLFLPSRAYNTANTQGKLQIQRCTNYQCIASWWQIHPSLPCFMILELDPVNISPLQAGSVLGTGSAWQGKETSIPNVLSGFLPASAAQVARAMQIIQRYSPLSEFQQHPYR